MTDQEKAEELRRYVCSPCMPNGEDALGLLNRTNRWKADLRNIWEVCERTALEMAKWKDDQFKEYLKKKLGEYAGGELVYAGVFIESIINELFKED